MKTIVLFFAAFLSASLAEAGGCNPVTHTLTGAKAGSFAKVLLLAGAKVKKLSKDRQNVSVKKLDCHETSGGVLEGMPDFRCESGPSKALKDELTAMALINALANANVWGEGGMSKTVFEAEEISCDISNAKQTCTLTSIDATTCRP